MLLTEYDANLHMKATYEQRFDEGHEAGLAERLNTGIKTMISFCKRRQISREVALHDLMLDFFYPNSRLLNIWKNTGNDKYTSFRKEDRGTNL